MIKISTTVFLFMFYTKGLLQAQIQQQPPAQLPKHVISKPQPNVQLLQLSNVIVGKWKGARLIQKTGAVTVDSVWFDFKADGTVSFKHQQYELNGPTGGTYIINKNNMAITIYKFPFRHTLQGSWNRTDGKINGNCTEVREADPSQPSYYTAGTDAGTFSLFKY
jgi:hypothetical protein